MFYNEKSFSFKDKLIGIGSIHADKKLLKSIVKSFVKYSEFYRFFIYATSSQVLVNKNSALLKTYLMRLPFLKETEQNLFSEFDIKLISEVNEFMQDFIRHGESSKAVKPISVNEFNKVFNNYRNEFSEVLNLMYEAGTKKFRLSDVVTLSNSFIGTIFKYDTQSKESVFHSDNSKLDLKALTDLEISKQLTVNRIIKLYPQKDTIVFIKPNQYRYWLSLTAYRDADKCFADLSNAGY